MNEKNLRRLDTETAREIGKKGGRISGERKRRRKKISAFLLDLLPRQLGKGEVMDALRAAGMEIDDETTNAAAFSYSLLLAAMKGNPQAARLMLQMIGEDPELEYKKKRDREERQLREKALDGIGKKGEYTISVRMCDEDAGT